MVDSHTAACCLITAVEQLTAEAGAPDFTHAYLSAGLTYPYCGHHAIVVRLSTPTSQHPDGASVSEDQADRVRVSYDRFEVAVLRDAPQMPDTEGCHAALYGDCDSPADCSTITGHHRIVAEERERLTRQLAARWCTCLAEHGRSQVAPTWLEATETIGEGRYSGTMFTVTALLK